MLLSAAVLAATLVATAADAREVVFPLVVDHALLRASLARQLGEDADGSALVWGTRGGCRSLVLRDLRVGPAAGRVRVSAQATAHLGFRFLGFCFAPLSWKGNVERSEEHTSELQSRLHLVCRLLLEKKKPKQRDRPLCPVAQQPSCTPPATTSPHTS